NNFFHCKFFRTAHGVKLLGKDSNENIFYGSEIRGDNKHANSMMGLLQDGKGEGNVWYGGAIENYSNGINVTGGRFSALGAYIEGFGTGRRIFLECDGNLSFKDCLFSALVDISGGQSFTFEDNTLGDYYDKDILNINFPLISVSADVPTKIYEKGTRHKE